MGTRVHLCGRLRIEWDGEHLEDALLRPPLSRLRSALGDGRLEGRTWVDRRAVRDGLRASREATDPQAALAEALALGMMRPLSAAAGVRGGTL